MLELVTVIQVPVPLVELRIIPPFATATKRPFTKATALNWLVVPERGAAMPARGGVGSAATNRPVVNPPIMQAQSTSVRLNRGGLRMDRSPEAS